MDSTKAVQVIRRHLVGTTRPDDADTLEALELAISAFVEVENLRLALERARRAPEQAEYEVRVWNQAPGRFGVDYVGSPPAWETVAWCPARQYAAIITEALLQPDRGIGEVNVYRKAEIWGPGRLTPQGREEGRRLYDRIWRCPACDAVGDGNRYGSSDGPTCFHCHQPLDVDYDQVDVAGGGGER